MNKICLDLNGLNLSVMDFEFLIKDVINPMVAVNGYALKWEYVIIDGIVELTACIVEV